MVGLVIVSHSRALAEALAGLVHQVSLTDVPLAIAAGIGPDREEFGTDAIEIVEAIQSVYSEDGVVILMDLGSAILSAEMALELLPEEMRAKIRFCAAPLVEGAIAAAVQAGLGSDRDTVCQEAQQALLPKIEHLAGAAEPSPAGLEDLADLPAEEFKDEETAREVTLTLKNLHGLHARPAARFVQTAGAFDADIKVRNLSTGKGPVAAKSLNALATLGAVREHQIQIFATGAEAEEALRALSQLVEENFGERVEAEDVEPARVTAPPSEKVEEGAMPAVPVSDGVAIAKFFRYQPPLPDIPEEGAKYPKQEWERFEEAIEATRRVIQKRRQELEAAVGEEQAAIFDAHQLILQDPELLDQVHERIFHDQENAAAAWHKSITQVAATYQALDDPYLQQRATDVFDVGNQVLFALAGKSVAAPIQFSEPVILFASELTPTETSQLDMSQVLGLITVGGGPTSHSAILARAMGIPAVAGAAPSLERLPGGTRVGLDGFEGLVWVDPAEEAVEKLQARREAWLEQRDRLLEVSHQPAVTQDGRRVEVAANVGNLMDAEMAVKNGAEAIGLLRTEFLFLTRETPPDEVEQLDALLQIGKVMGGRPVIVRTLDVGGDKALPYIDLPAEANPFLGVRAIRLSLRKPELFRTQLRAILRAAAEVNLRIMFPMIASVEEVQQARRLLEEVQKELQGEGLPHGWPIETGIMVEIPSAAVLSPILARQVDFFSIGTNDLTQYTLAAERGNPGLSNLADALHPAVLRLIQEVVKAAHQQGKWVGVCGELAGDPVAAPVLVGLGVDELSMNPGGIPQVKAVLRSIHAADSERLAEQVLESENAAAARRLAEAFLEERLEVYKG